MKIEKKYALHTFYSEKTPQKIQARLMNYKKVLENVKPNNFCGCSIKSGIYSQSYASCQKAKIIE